MLESIKRLFESLQPRPAPDPAFEHTLQMATAVLLVEVMRSDARISPQERAAALSTLRRHFTLSETELGTLMEIAEEQARNAHDLHTFTARVNEHLEPKEKARIVEYLWQVAYADGHLDAHEHHVMRKIADLLYIPHGDYVAAKMRARDQMA
ncbi:MAG: TerB family tellurite resistance protein [Rhizobacter sp.]